MRALRGWEGLSVKRLLQETGVGAGSHIVPGTSRGALHSVVYHLPHIMEAPVKDQQYKV